MARREMPSSRKRRILRIVAPPVAGVLGLATVYGGAQLAINKLAERQPQELRQLVELCEERDKLVYQQKMDLRKYETAVETWLTEAEREGRMQHPTIRAVAAERDSLQGVLNERNAKISRLMQDVQKAREEYARKVQSEQH